ncbi:unnamed protein product (mitochondrion) [Plasmodiophora brassicae]|uniref:Tubby C-terminal domain-containing protein n=1 Tax=Plasmodiophora brassicae TaxID=37360 RepID=A0A0G4J193_PLABS|nr:hypothetical protein PBRA_001941 [Plasmodiophora brassicae]SPR01363.1 unnamed protein product [Plasmodiophora brassicae]
MFVNKSLFDDESCDLQSEPVRPPNMVDAGQSYGFDATNDGTDGKKSKMKDMLAEQRALAAKKKDARRVVGAVNGVTMIRNDPVSASTKSRTLAQGHSFDDSNEIQDGKFGSSDGSSIDQIDPIYDPKEQKVVAIKGPEIEAEKNAEATNAPVDLSDMNRFLTSPASAPLQCYIIRIKDSIKSRLYPKYELYLKNGDRLILAAKKRTKNKSSNYLISKDSNDLNKASPNFLGKLRSNFIGTEFAIYDNGQSEKAVSKGGSAGTPKRKDLGCIFYQSNILGSRGPRKMTVLLPTKVSGSPGEVDISEAFKSGTHMNNARIVSLENKSPKWSDQVGAYVLNFNGRVTMASVKNFQLIQSGTDGSAAGATPATPEGPVIMQFGRVSKDNFTMDFRAPLSPLQAFAIALSSFDYKLACE